MKPSTDAMKPTGTPSSAFRTCFDLYMEGVASGIGFIFKKLAAIARTNEARLNLDQDQDSVAWAKEQALLMIREQRPRIPGWVRGACDGPDAEKNAKRWQAPRFLLMTPAGPEPWDAERAWERMDTASSLEVIETFADEYVRRLEDYIEEKAGQERKRTIQ